MPSRLRVKVTGEPVQGSSLYDQDFAQWVGRQVELFRTGQAASLDVPNLIEELEGLTKRDERALGSQLKRIMAHLLKQRHQPQRATRSWADSIANGREEVADIREQSPSLRRTLPGLMLRGSRSAPARPDGRVGHRAGDGFALDHYRDGPLFSDRRSCHLGAEFAAVEKIPLVCYTALRGREVTFPSQTVRPCQSAATLTR
jgi:hypothetical protein